MAEEEPEDSRSRRDLAQWPLVPTGEIVTSALRAVEDLMRKARSRSQSAFATQKDEINADVLKAIHLLKLIEKVLVKAGAEKKPVNFSD